MGEEKKSKIENMMRRFNEKFNQVNFLDVDLDEDWTVSYFKMKASVRKEDYWSIVMSQSKEFDELGDVSEIFSEFGLESREVILISEFLGAKINLGKFCMEQRSQSHMGSTNACKSTGRKAPCNQLVTKTSRKSAPPHGVVKHHRNRQKRLA